MLGSTRTYGPSGVPVTVAMEPVGCCASAGIADGIKMPNTITALATSSKIANLPKHTINLFSQNNGSDQYDRAQQNERRDKDAGSHHRSTRWADLCELRNSQRRRQREGG